MCPCYKDYIWGGNRLKKEFGKLNAPDTAAESWELSCHTDGVSTVLDGEYAGMSIAELGGIDRKGFWGYKCCDADFPILVKLIDANSDLSVQVHPSDITADGSKGEHGKAEMWYIVDCKPKAFIYLGFSQKVTKRQFLNCVDRGDICGILNRVPVEPGDVFYILPGTIHAIGAGIVIAEIQQNSNTTFRVYDYQRRDAKGNLRQLHLDRAADVLEYAPIMPEECKANSMASFSEFTLTEMFSCQYFRAYRIDVHPVVTLMCDGSSFEHILCVEGTGEIVSGGVNYPFERGDSFFIPAALGEYMIKGENRVLLSRI